MDDLPVQKISISGPALASIIQRFSSSAGDVDGLLFGHVNDVTPSNLQDDDLPESSSTLVATITSYFCSGTVNSFYDSLGHLDHTALRRLLSGRGPDRSLIGWFVGRRKTPLRPSMREASVSASLSIKTLTLIPPEDPLNFPPCIFVVFTTPLADQLIHTHEHRAFQFRRSAGVFEQKSMDVVNLGPAFRGHYGAFCPNSAFPWLPCVLRDSSMAEDSSNESLNQMKGISKEQSGLDMCAEGFEVGRLSRLMGFEAANYTSELEDLYGKMLAKLEGLAQLVEKSSARVLEQVN
ncbi:hypothetical protein HHK36_010650 [Tetracentron sinense]|uniref:BRCA1-A complex subunit Abraxas n=1 Tax=Tetracentron sinense TaxID=13715 RepID=A0A834Z6Q3_TETSI|nr:hypothetical protein HHK36_010650 [Tetracentron sinense]